jgi:hypothetical protein
MRLLSAEVIGIRSPLFIRSSAQKKSLIKVVEHDQSRERRSDERLMTLR